MNLNGRRKIYTDELNINENNIDRVLCNAFPLHEANRVEIKYLIDYEKGKHPILEREKDIRPDVDNRIVENRACSITAFKVGYEAGSPITFVQRAKREAKTISDDDVRISALNEMFFEENKPAKDIQLFRDFKIGGYGYMAAFPKKEKFGVSPFDLLVLDPLNTFVVYANDCYRKPILAVTYNELQNGVKEIIAYSDKYVFEVGFKRREDKVQENELPYARTHFKVSPNIIGKIPIIQFINNYDLMGCFEAAVPLMDALDVATSDRVNDISQFVQSLLWLHNCDIDQEGKNRLVDGNGLIVTRTTSDGREAKIVYLTQTLNQSETQTFIDYLDEQVLDICGVPSREKSSGGNTGSAILLSNGWQLAETQAKSMELTYGQSIRELLSVVLAIISNDEDTDAEMKTLKVSDIIPKFSRNKTYDLVSRVNSLVTLVNAGFDLEKSVSLVDISDDPLQYAIDSKEGVNQIRFAKISTVTEPKTEENLNLTQGSNVKS
jgi:SPP1 family phage portal protein